MIMKFPPANCLSGEEGKSS